MNTIIFDMHEKNDEAKLISDKFYLESSHFIR